MLTVNNVTMQSTKDHRLAQICCNTVEDPTITAFAEVIARGWPDKKKVLNDSLNDYRDKLTVQDGLILQRQRIATWFIW